MLFEDSIIRRPIRFMHQMKIELIDLGTNKERILFVTAKVLFESPHIKRFNNVCPCGKKMQCVRDEKCLDTKHTSIGNNTADMNYLKKYSSPKESKGSLVKRYAYAYRKINTI